MKKLTSILFIGLTVASLTTFGFDRPDKYQGSPGNVTQLPSDQQQKKDTVAKVSYTCPMHPDVIQDKPGKCPKCKMNLVKKEVASVVYTCPMHPEVIQDKPGKCPKCKMNLVKKEVSPKVDLNKK